MRLKIYLLLILSVLAISLLADNIMQVSNQNAGAFETVNIALNIDNTDSFSAFQTDIVLAHGVSYVANSAVLSGRSNGHLLSASLLPNNVLRIFAYSFSNALFIGNNGAVLNFQIQTSGQPGSFSLNLQNSIISDVNSVNILDNAISGAVLVTAPNIESNTLLLDFDEIPLLSYNEVAFTLYNTGNAVLNVSNIEFNSPYFEIIGNTSFSISANNQRNIVVRFNSVVKGTYNNVMSIISNDPDQGTYNINLQAIAFAVNELYIQATTGVSGSTFSIPFNIENMESFSAFQFDFQVSDNLQFDIVNVELSERSNGHTASAQLLNNNVIRVIAFSLNNNTFTGNSGIVAHLNIRISGLGGYYSINPENVIISDTSGINILSESYGSYFNIAAPSMHLNNNLNFGDISITETGQAELNINNWGNADLVITSVNISNPAFTLLSTLPLTIAAGTNADLIVNFHNSNVGNYQSNLRIFSNDQNQPICNVSLNANTYSPNYLSVLETYSSPGEIVTISVDAENYHSFVAFQFDMEFPGDLNYIQNSARLSTRANDHILLTTTLSDNVLRFISYSPTQNIFSENTGVVLELDFIVNENASGNQLVSLNNGILADANSRNILREMFNAEVILNNRPFVVMEIADITFDEDTIFTGLDLNNVFDDVDIPYGDVLTFSSSEHENLTITIENGIVTMTPAQDWFGQYIVTFTATDNSLASISTDALVTVVSVNDAPVIELPESFTGYEDIAFSVDFAPFISDNDNALEELTLSAVSGENIVVSIEGHTVTFTPAQDWSGTEEIIFTVDDGVDRSSVRLPRYASNDGGRFFANAQNDNDLNARNEGDRLLRFARNDRQRASSSASVSVTFLPINDAPYVANEIEDITFDEDTIFTGLNLNTVFNDVDIPYGDVLTFSSSTHENIDITIENGIVTMTPAQDWFGQHTVTFTATDDSLASISTDALVTVVSVNDAPVIELPESFTGYEDIAFSVDFAPFISDNDNALEELTLSAVSGDNITASIDGHIVTFTPAQDWSGTEEIIFTVDDGVDRSSVRLPRYARNDGGRFFANAQKDNGLNARNDGGRFFANAQKDNGLNARNEGDRLLRFARNDRQRASSSASVNVIFLPINDVPYVANEIEDITFDEDTIFTGLDLNNVFDDVDIPYGDVLTFSSSTHENLDITIENGIVTMIPAQDWFGQYTVTFTATDDSLASVSTDAIVTVLPVNDAPVIELPASFTGYEDIPLAIDFAPFISDNDNALEELTLSAVSGDNIVVSIEGHTVTFTPAQDWSGTEEIIFTVDDGVDRSSVRLPRYARNDREVNARNDNGRFFANAQNDNDLRMKTSKHLPVLTSQRFFANAQNDKVLSSRVSSSASVSITFLPINDAPYVANPIEDITFDEDTIFTGLDLNNVFDDVDIPYGDVLTFSSSEHENLTITIENGIVTMTPALNWFGQHTVTFAATDDSLASVSTDVLVTVLPVNDAPEIVSVLPDSTQMEIFENTIIEFSVVATDVDNEELFYSWFINEIQAESDSSSFVYDFPENGEFEIKIVVSDGELTAEHIWEITVNSTNINDYVVLKTNLEANYPNPFNPTTTISFDLLIPGKVNISIYNIKGQLVKELINDELKNGRHKILWNGQDQFNRSVGSGIYFYKMQTKDYTKVRRMIMIK